MVKKSLDWHKVRFIDTHCHLDYDLFAHDIEDVIKRAVDQGVTRIIAPGLNIQSSRAVVRLAEKFTEVYAAIGLHPGDVDKWHSAYITEFTPLINHEKVVAIGEIGLDNYHRQDNFSEQKATLEIFLEFALQNDKPVILHSRACLPELIKIIQKIRQLPDQKGLRGVFHAFEGNLDDAKQLASFGFYLGVGGPVTYKNAAIKQEVFSKIDMSNILLETDGPFLSPQNHRGQRNEPAQIPNIARKIAELRKCDINEIAERTTMNAINLFSGIK